MTIFQGYLQVLAWGMENTWYWYIPFSGNITRIRRVR